MPVQTNLCLQAADCFLDWGINKYYLVWLGYGQIAKFPAHDFSIKPLAPILLPNFGTLESQVRDCKAVSNHQATDGTRAPDLIGPQIAIKSVKGGY